MLFKIQLEVLLNAKITTYSIDKFNVIIIIIICENKHVRFRKYYFTAHIDNGGIQAWRFFNNFFLEWKK